jgi:hypothetical protein
VISVAAPWVLAVAGVGALMTCVLHFLSVRRPPTLALPTMRFLPDKPVRAVSKSVRPSDLLLLVLRVAALLLAGIAMAGVSWNSSRINSGRIVVIDRNGGSVGALRGGAAATLREPGRDGAASTSERVATKIIVVDSSAHLLSATEARALRPDTLSVTHSTVALSSALLASVRAASVMLHDEPRIDSLTLNIISPFFERSDDAALQSVRRLWPGSITLIEVGPDSARYAATAASVRVQYVGTSPNAAVLSALALPSGTANVNATARASANVNATAPANATNAASATQQVNIEWPANGIPTGWTAQAPDTIGAIVTRGQALVWPFIRTAHVPDSLRHMSRAIAWWSDGSIAAIERTNASGCTRQIGAVVSSYSDALQGSSARAVSDVLTAACGTVHTSAPLSPITRQLLAGKGGAASAAAFRSDRKIQTQFASLLLFAALVLLSLEWWIRDRDKEAARQQSDESPLRKVA